MIQNKLVLLSSVLSLSFVVMAPQARAANLASMQATEHALELSLNERVSELRNQESQSHDAYQNLVKIMFDRSKPMEVRWKAVTAAGRIGGNASRADLERAFRSNEWFMRNAALIAMRPVDRALTLAWAKKLLSDKALVVRLAAVDTISGLNDVSSTSLLWQKLNARENFKGGQSLFIRRRIVEALADMEGSGREGQFVTLLSDRDESLHAPAMKALDRITNHALGVETEPSPGKRAQWQQWWSNRKSL